MSTTEAPYVVSHNFCAIRGTTIEELEARLKDFVNSDSISELIGEFRDAVANQPKPFTDAQGVANAQAALGGTVISETAAPAAAPAAPAGPEVVTDKYGNQYTYGLAEAPQLPDGRGFYIKKSWTSQKGKRLVAWVDPIKGPKPATPGAAEAELIWI